MSNELITEVVFATYQHIGFTLLGNYKVQSPFQLRDHFFEPLFAIFPVKTIKLVTKRLINTLVEPYLLT